MKNIESKVCGLDRYLASSLLGYLRWAGRVEWEKEHGFSVWGHCLVKKEWESIFESEEKFQKENFNLQFFHQQGWQELFGSRPKLGTITMQKLNRLFVSAGMTELKGPSSSKIPEFISLHPVK